MKFRLKPIAVTAALLGVPMAAWADPITVVAALAPYIGGTAAAFVASTAAFVAANATAIAFGASVFNAYRTRRMAKKENAARIREYNASLTDRMITAAREEAPERYIYGECEVGGDVVALFTSDITGNDGRVKPDGYKHLVVVCAAHRVKAIKDIKIDGVSLGLVNGAATAPEFTYPSDSVRTETATGGTASLTAGFPVISVPGNQIVARKGDLSVLVPAGGANGYSLSGKVFTFPAQINTPSGLLTVDSTWTWNVTYVADVKFTVVGITVPDVPAAKVYASTFNGSATQAANDYLQRCVPGQWLDSDRLQGRAGAVITLDLQESRFQGGIPRITFVIEGRDEIYDPRVNTVPDPEFFNGSVFAAVSNNGVSITQAGQAVEDGRRCIDYRVQGTGGAGGAFPQLIIPSSPASSGQTWWAGCEVRNLSGTAPSFTPNIQAYGLDAGSALTNSNGTGWNLEALGLRSIVKSRASISLNVTNPATVRVGGRVLWTIDPGQAVDFTVRVALPTLSQGRDAVGYTANVALCCDDWLRSARWGFGVIPNAAETIAAANACDVTTTFTEYAFPSSGVGPPSPVITTGPRYVMGGAFTSADDKESVISQMAAAMGGRVVDGAEYLIQAGAWTPPVMDLIEGTEAGPIQIVQTGEGLDTLINGVRAKYIPLGDGVPADVRPPYQNSVFVAADGQELWEDAAFPFTTSAARARNLCRLRVEEMRNGLVITYPAKLRAWNLRPGQRVRVSNAERGWTLKHFRITDWQFAHGGVVLLTLREDAESSWDDADAATVEPTPNSDLPNPFVVDPVTAGVSFASGTAQLLRLQDGTIVPRVLAQWTPRTDSFMAGNGKVEIAWQEVGATTWNIANAGGLDGSAYIQGVKEGRVLLIRLTAVNSLGQRSAAAYWLHQVIGKTAPPAAVQGLSLSVIPGALRGTRTPSAEADWATTIYRYGASFAAGTTVPGTVDQNGFTWPSPFLGPVTIWAADVDTSGNIGPAVSATITVDNRALVTAGGALNRNPACDDPTAWALDAGLSLQTGTSASGAVGRSFTRWDSGLNRFAWSSETIPLNPNKRYSLTANLLALAGNDRLQYLIVDMFDGAGARVSTTWGGTYSGYAFFGVVAGDGTWRQYGQVFGKETPRSIPANVAYCRVGLGFQFGVSANPAVAQAAQDVRLQEVIGWGEVQTDNVANNAITNTGATAYPSSTSPGFPGGSQAVLGFLVGPTITLTDEDVLEFNINSSHDQDQLAQSDSIRYLSYFTVEIWLTGAKDGGTQSEMGVRSHGTIMCRGPNLQTRIPVQHRAQVQPGAGSWSFQLTYRIRAYGEDGALTSRCTSWGNQGEWSWTKTKR